MTSQEFDWRVVVGAWAHADLSCRIHGPDEIEDHDPPLWPSDAYRDAFYEMRRRIIVPPKTGTLMTTTFVGEVADAMFEELAKALRKQDPDPFTRQRWEEAAEALLEAKRLAHETIPPKPLIAP